MNTLPRYKYHMNRKKSESAMLFASSIVAAIIVACLAASTITSCSQNQPQPATTQPTTQPATTPNNPATSPDEDGCLSTYWWGCSKFLRNHK